MFIHPNHSLIHEKGTTLLHRQLVSKSQFCPKNIPRGSPFGCVAKTLLRPGEVPFFATNKCLFLKEGTMHFAMPF
jgi:hypothetical protein